MKFYCCKKFKQDYLDIWRKRNKIHIVACCDNLGSEFIIEYSRLRKALKEYEGWKKNDA